MDGNLEEMLLGLKTQLQPWDILNESGREILEKFRRSEPVDVIYAALVSQGITGLKLRWYMKKAENLCKRIEKEIPNISEFPDYERGQAIFDKLWDKYIRDVDEDQYKLTGAIDTGVGNCVGLSAFVGGVMKRFGLDVVFQDYLGSSDAHINVGVMCSSKDEQSIITVESTVSSGYDAPYITPYEYRHHNNYDSRLICAENMVWRGWELEEKHRVDDFQLLKIQLVCQEFVPERMISLANVAAYLYNLRIEPKTEHKIEFDVQLMNGLLEYILEIDPLYLRAYHLLSLVNAPED